MFGVHRLAAGMPQVRGIGTVWSVSSSTCLDRWSGTARWSPWALTLAALLMIWMRRQRWSSDSEPVRSVLAAAAALAQDATHLPGLREGHHAARTGLSTC